MADDAQSIEDLQQPNTQPLRYTKSDYLYLNDINQGNYAGGSQIQYDTQAVANNNAYVRWDQAYLEIPMLLTTVGGSASAPGALGLAFKGMGYAGIVSSVLVTLNGVQVNNQAPWQGAIMGFRLLNDMSQTKVDQIGSLINFCPDTSDSYTINGSSQTTYGITNNVVSENYAATQATVTAPLSELPLAPTFSYADTSVGVTTPAINASLIGKQNKGLFRRAKWLANNANALQPVAASGLLINQPSTSTASTAFAASAAGASKNTVTINVAGHNSSYNVIGIIRLRDLHSCFANMTMAVRNLRVQIFLNLNLPGPTGTLIGSFNPLMITDMGTGTGISTAGSLVATNVTSATLAIGQANGNTATRIYFPTVQLPAVVEREITSWRRQICYLDTQQFALTNAALPGAQLNWLISSGIQNLRRLIFWPFITAASNNNAATLPASVAVSPYNAYTSTEPFTATPGALLTSIALQINGRQFMANYIVPSYEQYIQQQITQFMGGLQEDTLVSGLYSYYDFNQSYGIYTFDVSRNPDIRSSDVPCSIQLLATNSSPFTIDLICIAEFESAFELNQSSTNLTVTMSRPPLLPL